MRGYTYKSREEVIHHIGIDLAHEFHKNAYDALTHNCNHFSCPAAQVFGMLQFYMRRLKRGWILVRHSDLGTAATTCN